MFWTCLLLSSLLQSPPIIPPDTNFSRYTTDKPWVLTPEFLQAATDDIDGLDNFYEDRVGQLNLPSLLKPTSQPPIEQPADWTTRERPRLLKLFRDIVFGHEPPAPPNQVSSVNRIDDQAFGGTAHYEHIAISFDVGQARFEFPVYLFIPKNATGPVPVFLLLNHRSPENTDPSRQIQSEFWPAEYVVGRGYAIAAINTALDIDPDQPNQSTGLRAFYRTHDPTNHYTWGTLAAWGWAASRACDYFETHPQIDSTRIAIVGHSRSGKTALWAAARDERFALACVNNSGEGGASLSRRNFGEQLKHLTANYPHWFVPKYAEYGDDPSTLPFDQHQLIALIAPRGYHAGEGERDLHADPRGSWLALQQAAPAWKLLPTPTRQPPFLPDFPEEMPHLNQLFSAGLLAYHIRTGGHALTTYDWKLYLDHAEQQWGTPPAAINRPLESIR